MLADPRRSCIFWIHPDRCFGIGQDVAATLWPKRFAMLAAAREVFDVPVFLVGERHQTIAGARPSLRDIVELDVDPLLLWQSGWRAPRGDLNEPGLVVIGGAWVEEEVLIAAVGAATLGYDVRLLSDLSIARCEADRRLVVDRLHLYGIAETVLSQTLLEWASCLQDPVRIGRVRELLG